MYFVSFCMDRVCIKLLVKNIVHNKNSNQIYVNKQALPLGQLYPGPPSGPSLSPKAVTYWTLDPHYFLYLPSLYTSPTPPNTPSSPDAPTQAANPTPSGTTTLSHTPTPSGNPTPSGTPTLIATTTPFASPTPFAAPIPSGHPTSPTKSSFPFWPTWPPMQTNLQYFP